MRVLPQLKGSQAKITAKEEYIGAINYSDFTLTFEPFEAIPETFDFIEGDVQGAFVIRNISLRNGKKINVRQMSGCFLY